MFLYAHDQTTGNIKTFAPFQTLYDQDNYLLQKKNVFKKALKTQEYKQVSEQGCQRGRLMGAGVTGFCEPPIVGAW